MLTKSLLFAMNMPLKLPKALFSSTKRTENQPFIVEGIRNTILQKDREETRKLKEVLKRKHDYLQEASVSFYELEINIELYYQHNSFQSMYVKSLLDFSNINFTGVSLLAI